MVLQYHKGNYAKIAGEEEVLAAMREAGVQPGSYYFPNCTEPKDLAAPEMQEKFKAGPVGFMTVVPNGAPAMGKRLVSWFVYSIVVSACVAYLATRTMAAGADDLAVFRVVGTTAVLAYGFAHVSDSIWKGQSWGSAFKHLLDGFIYGCVTGGAFGWLRP